MKKIATLIAIAGLAAGAYAQGLVSLTDTSVFISTNTTGTAGLLAGNGNYYFELLYQLDTGQAAPTFTASASGLAAWTDSTLSGTNNTALGHAQAGIAGENGTTGITVSGWGGGQYAYYVVLGWSGNEGNWTNVVAAINTAGGWLNPNGLFGYSMIGHAEAASSPAPAQILFGTATGLINTGWSLTPVPEPTTLALAGLGGLSLLLLRRRK